MKRIILLSLVMMLCLPVLCACTETNIPDAGTVTNTETEIPSTAEKTKDNNYSVGTRIYDFYHPDDSEVNPFFDITFSASQDNLRIENRDPKECSEGGVYVNDELILDKCDSFYISDLNGDGKSELCFVTHIGSGITSWYIEIFDSVSKTKIFTLRDFLRHDYYLFLRDGILCVKETELNEKEAVRTGILIYGGDGVSVEWDKTVDDRVDVKQYLTGEPIL